MRHLASFSTCALLASAVLSQTEARTPTRVDVTSIGSAQRPSIASRGDRSVIVYTEGAPGGTETVWLVSSDGRGRDWSAPTRVDAGPLWVRKATGPDSCAVFGDTVFVAWADERFGGVELLFNRSVDGGASFTGEQLLDKGHPVGAGQIISWQMQAPTAVDVYVLMTVQPPVGINDELWLTSSHDGGATFDSTVRVDTANANVRLADFTIDPTNPAVVQVAWADDRLTPLDYEVWHRRSIDAGVSFGPERQISVAGPGAGSAEELIRVKTNGGAVCIAWLDEFSSLYEEVRVAFSVDAGASFGTDVGLGGYAPGLDDVDSLAAGAFGTTYYVAWNDDRTGDDLVYVTSTPDFGATWRPEHVIDGDRARAFEFAGAPDGSVVGLVSTAEVAAPDEVRLTWTTDGGLGYTSSALSDQPTQDADDPSIEFDATYRNFVATWTSNAGGPLPPFPTTERVFAGGRRPQTCTPIGWDAIHDPAEPVLRFDISHFGADPVALVGFSTGLGPIPVGDGRVLDLGPTLLSFGDPAFVASLSGGAGSTITLPNVFAGGGPPLGITLHYSAVGFDAALSETRWSDSGTVEL